MTDLEQQVTDMLAVRAESVRPEERLGRIVDGLQPPPLVAQHVEVRQSMSKSPTNRQTVRTIGVAACLLVAIGGLVLVSRNQDSTAPAVEPSITPTDTRPTTTLEATGAADTLSPSATPDRIDAFPIINWPADPVADVYASYGERHSDQGWTGAIGTLGSGDVPQSVIGINVFPQNSPMPVLPDATPGSRSDVYESSGPNGTITLNRLVDGHPVLVIGSDSELLYEIVNLVRPQSASDSVEGYAFSGPLPEGLTQIAAPYHRTPMSVPILSTDDGTFSVSVQDGPLLGMLGAGPTMQFEPVTIGRLNGYQSINGNALIALALNSDETLMLQSSVMSLDELTEIAGHITLTDHATWVAQYDPVGTDAATPPTTTP